MPPLIDATAPSPRTGELVPQYPWVTAGGRHRFLPWWDPDQPVTPEIRRGLRKMIADDAVKPALLTKLFSVSSLDWQFQPADPTDPRSRLVSDFCLYGAQHMDGGTRALAEEVLFPGLVDGLSVCEIVSREEPEPHGRWAGKEMLRCLKAKEHAWPEEDRYGNVTGIYAQTELGWTTLPPERFVVFKYLPLFGRPHSDLQAAYRLYVARDALMKLWLVGIERWGQPFAEGTYPAGDDQSKSELVASLGGLKSRSWVVHPDGTAVKFVDSAFQGRAAHEACWQKLTEGIYLSINGAFLTSLTSGTQHLSQRGDSGVQKGTFELFVWHLASVIADCTNAKVWPLVTSRNFVGAAPPRATLGGVNDADLKVSADLDDVLVNKLRMPLSRKDRAAYYGRQLAETPEDALTPAAPKAAPAPPPAAGNPVTPFAEPDSAVADLHALGPLLTVREVAERLRLSPGTVRRLCDGGHLEHRRPGGRYRVSERGLAAYLSGEGPTRPFAEPGAGGQFAPGGGRVPGSGGEAGGGRPKGAHRVTTTVQERPGGSTVVTFASAAGAADRLKTFLGPKGLRVKSAFVGESARGQGLGVALYESAIRFAHGRSLPLQSDEFVSKDAVRVWQALERRGHRVVRHPATPDSEGGLNAVEDKGAVFSIPPPAGGPGSGGDNPHPRHLREAARELAAAHPHPGAPPVLPPGAGRPDLLAKDPKLAAAEAVRAAHLRRQNKADVAEAADRMLNGRGPRPVPLPGPGAGGGQRISRAKRAAERAGEAHQDVLTLTHPAFAAHRAEVAAAHPHGPAVLEAAAAEARRRLAEAVRVAKGHVAALPEGKRAQGERYLAERLPG